MFVLRSSISVQVSKKMFGIINKRQSPNKHWGGLEKKKINKLGGRWNSRVNIANFYKVVSSIFFAKMN